jgi:hypothetical protein
MVEPRKRTDTPNKRSKKSLELRKYEIAYNKCIKLGTKLKKSKKKVYSRKKSNAVYDRNFLKSRRYRKIRIKTKSRSLNPYQKFVRSESSKSIYKGMKVQKRMQAISKLWKRSK